MYNIGEKRQRRAKVAASHMMALAMVLMMGGVGPTFGYAPARGVHMGNPCWAPKRTKLKGWQKAARK